MMLIIVLLSACATTTKNITPKIKKPEISVKNLIETCGAPVESHFIQRLGVKAHRHKNCMGIDDLLSLVWADKLSKEKVLKTTHFDKISNNVLIL